LLGADGFLNIQGGKGGKKAVHKVGKEAVVWHVKEVCYSLAAGETPWETQSNWKKIHGHQEPGMTPRRETRRDTHHCRSNRLTGGAGAHRQVGGVVGPGENCEFFGRKMPDRSRGDKNTRP